MNTLTVHFPDWVVWAVGIWCLAQAVLTCQNIYLIYLRHKIGKIKKTLGEV